VCQTPPDRGLLAEAHGLVAGSIDGAMRVSRTARDMHHPGSTTEFAPYLTQDGQRRKARQRRAARGIELSMALMSPIVPT
jgi:hypothetical protein